MSDPLPVLEYAGIRHEMPRGSRIELSRLEGGGVRFVHPALGWRMVRGKVALSLGLMAFGLMIVIIIAASWRSTDTRSLFFALAVSMAAICLSIALWIEARVRATKSLMIEAREGILHVERPRFWGRARRFKAEDLRDIFPGVTLPYIELGKKVRMVSSLLIASRSFLAMRVLENHDVNEIEWIVGELRVALAMGGRSSL